MAKYEIRNSQLTLLTIFKYLPGCVLYHKIALLDRKIRQEILINSALLDQEVTITQRCQNDEPILNKKQSFSGLVSSNPVGSHGRNGVFGQVNTF